MIAHCRQKALLLFTPPFHPSHLSYTPSLPPFLFVLIFFILNMSQEPTKKRIKLSLEPAIDNNVVDITNAGQEILKT